MIWLIVMRAEADTLEERLWPAVKDAPTVMQFLAVAGDVTVVCP